MANFVIYNGENYEEIMAFCKGRAYISCSSRGKMKLMLHKAFSKPLEIIKGDYIVADSDYSIKRL